MILLAVGLLLATGSLVQRLGGQAVSWNPAEPGSPRSHEAADTVFRHGAHESIDCVTCHDTNETHGSLRFAEPEGCSSCHHDQAAYPSCDQCHAPATEMPPLRVTRTLDLSTGPTEARPLPFEHALHSDIECASCHSDPATTLLDPGGDCSSCHEDHHEPQAACLACHTGDSPSHQSPPALGALDPHEGCEGAGCHASVPVQLDPWTRQACLTCHEDQQDHEPAQDDCASCHMVPHIRSTTR